MTPDDVISRADQNYYYAWQGLVSAVRGGEVRVFDGVVIGDTGLQVAPLNIAFVTRPLADPTTTLRRVTQYFGERNRPYVVRVRDGLDERAEDALRQLGLRHNDDVPSMALTPIGAATPVEIDVRTAHDARELELHAEIVGASFGMPPEVSRALLQPPLLRLPDSEIYVGHVDGKPVASSVLVASHRTAGVYNVGVLPEYRRRGLGEAMTWHAVHRGAEMGCVMASLQASEMGRPVYERMGFRTVTRYRTYVREGQQ